MKRSPRLRASRSWRGVVLRCLLMVVAWQGPMPWWHSHGTLGSGADVGAGWLASHLAAYHPECVTPACTIGWHMHLLYPASPSSDNEGNAPLQEQNRLPCAGTDGLTAVASLVSASTLASWPTCERLPGYTARDLFAAPSHFFDGFAPTLALPLRLGVARC